eukprot:TRINITY_DN16637_c0_g1_i1.p1 TRINITY_DN16637_c0_g1~~TRINITY_DN16637_c0_g1_i1.p1  ORF type:complete len:219 (-),score=40.48 TRINITY_DN16637_c0_g1_i1:117-773(-)
MSYYYLFCLISICFLSIVTNTVEITIPKHTPGHAIGNSSAPIKLEMFIDWQCSDSKQAWPTVYSIVQHYGPDKIYFVFHVLQLWFFRQSGDLALAAEIIAQHGKSGSYWDMTTYLFDVQPNYYNHMWYTKTEQDLYNELAVIGAKFGVDNSTFFSEISQWEQGDVWDAVNTAHVYAKTQQIINTPTFMVNGFKDLTLNEDTTTEQWMAYIDALLANKK